MSRFFLFCCCSCRLSLIDLHHWPTSISYGSQIICVRITSSREITFSHWYVFLCFSSARKEKKWPVSCVIIEWISTVTSYFWLVDLSLSSFCYFHWLIIITTWKSNNIKWSHEDVIVMYIQEVDVSCGGWSLPASLPSASSCVVLS